MDRFKVTVTERGSEEAEAARGCEACQIADAVAEHTPEELRHQGAEPLLPLED